MRTTEPLSPATEVLSTLGTGLWHWDIAADRITVDAEAARLVGLPPHANRLRQAQLRARIHPVDWTEAAAVVQLAAAERTMAEARLRVMDEHGRVVRTLRFRCKPAYDTEHDTYVFTGTAQEVTEPTPGTATRGQVTGDWRRNREAFLLDAGRALAEARSTEEVLRVAASLSMPGFSPDGLVVYGVEGDRLTVIGHHGQGVDETILPFADMALDTPYPGCDVIRNGRAVYLTSPEEYQRRYPTTWPFAARFGRRSWAFLPLTVAGRSIGAWMAGFRHQVRFTPDERSVLTTVARLLAQALSRAGAAESERELSRSLQRSMLPNLGPEIPGMSLAARYVPTGGGLVVGGDWYDMIPLPGGASASDGTGGGRFALVIGDVQGHDVRAAGLMGQLRIALRAYASEGHRPDAVLSRASRFLAGITSSTSEEADARFATCLYVEVAPDTGTLTMARAGHPHPAARLPDGTALLRLTKGGLPLGIDPDADYPTTEFVMEPGETVLMCTDGLIETGGHDMDTGWERVKEVLNSSDGDPETLADDLLQTVLGPRSHSHTGPLPDRRGDDVALLLLSRHTLESLGGRGPAARLHIRRLALTVAQDAPERISAARSQLHELLHDWASEEQRDAAILLASEMITNVLVHTDADALLVAEIYGPVDDRRLRVEVTDPSDDLPHKRDPGELASSGRGLILMEVLADVWGVDPRGVGKSIWFELRELHEVHEREPSAVPEPA